MKIDKKLIRNFDWITLLLITAIAICSLVFIANTTASPFTGEERTLSDYMEKIDLTYVWLQLIWFGIGLVVMVIIQIIDYHSLGELAKLIYAVTLILLVALLVLGVTSRGAAAWFKLGGGRAFQPSELCKVTLIIILSKYAAKAVERDGKVKRIKDIAILVGLMAVPFALVILQYDFGTAMVYLFILAGILFAAKLSYKIILPVVGAMGASLPLLYNYVFDETQRLRIDVFLDPEKYVQGAGYNVVQSKMAIGSGQLSGKGLFSQESLSRLNFIPEKHTDFIFAASVEAVGFVGGAIIILLYFLLLIRALFLVSKAKDNFGAFLIIGVVSMMLFHIFENIGMTMGLTPVTGIPLPLMSYGGSNFFTTMIAFGIVLNVGMRRAQRR